MNDATPSPVLVRQDGASRILTINQPARRNALDAVTRDALQQALQDAYADADTQIILLEGDARSFCAGGDVSTMRGMTPEQADARIRAAHVLPRMIHEGPKPVIAVVEGACVGAGLGLAAICDLVVASESARFVTAFEKVGFMPDFGAAWSLAQRMGPQAAKRWLLLGGEMRGADAAAAGLADACTPPGQAMAHAMELAARLIANAPATRRSVRDVFRDMPSGLETVLALEVERQAQLYRSRDAAEGIQAFIDRRPPVWQDA